MKKKYIVKNSRDFEKIIKEGKCKKNKSFIIHSKKNELDYDKYGISVSKKVGNSIVRHRLTRLIRESVRLNVENINKGYDIVIIARTTLKGKKFAETESAFLHLAKLHGIRCL